MSNRRSINGNPIDTAANFAIASHMAWIDALANAVINGDISTDAGMQIANEAEEATRILMLGGKLDEGMLSEAQLLPGNEVFDKTSHDLAEEVISIAVELQKQEAYNDVQ